MKQIIFTDQNWTGLVLRLTLGLIMFPHGAQKMLGLFGGYGFRASLNFFTGNMHLPGLISFLIIVIEFICPVVLIPGFCGRICAGLLMVIMVGAIITTNGRNGFFMNWFGSQPGEGFEYHLLVIGICVALLFSGSGRYSIDGLLSAPGRFLLKQEF